MGIAKVAKFLQDLLASSGDIVLEPLTNPNP